MIGLVVLGLIVATAQAALPDIYSGCGVTKGCFGLPSGCLDTQSCTVASSFAKQDETSLVFEIYGDAFNGGESYVAVGFSDDMRMNNDSVTECVVFGGVVDIFQSANQPDDPDLIHRNRRLADSKLGLTLQEGLFEEGKLYCKFTRQTVLTINTLVYDLTNDYHLLMAAGTAIATGVREHDGTIQGMSGDRVDFDAFSVQKAAHPLLRGKAIPNVYEGCGSTKGCFGTPRYCEPTSNCNLIVTYKRHDDSSYEFELFGKLIQEENTYLAVGFSFDGDMNDDSVTECVQLGGQFNLYNSYNVKATTDAERNNTRLPAEMQTGLELLDSTIDAGNMYCRFTRSNILEIEGSVFDLTKEWYLVVASGTASETNIDNHEGVGYASHTREAVLLDEPRVPTTAAPATTPSGPVVYDGCGSTKGCFGTPRECEATKTCLVLVTYRKADEESYEFEMYGEIHADQNSYVAVGFSFDSTMDHDSVSECVWRPSGVKMHFSHNYPVGSDEVRRNRRMKADQQDGHALLDWKTENGFLYCKFSRQNLKVVNGTEFDLRNDWYLLIASGGGTDTNLLTHDDGGYADNTLFPVNLADPSIPTVTTPAPPSNVHPVYTGCGEVKGCFGHPNRCVDDGSCTTVVTYKNVSDSQFEFELYGVKYSSKKHKAMGSYVAVAFSNDVKMGDDSVTDCSVVGGAVDVAMSYNTGHHNARLSDPHLGLALIEGRDEDGYIYCRFTRNSSIDHNSQTWDIGNTDYHLLLAAGPADLGALHEHHAHAASQNKIHLNDFGGVFIRDVANLFTWHGIFMTVAWMFLISAATFLPAHHKQSWSDKKMFDSAVWFSLHRLITGAGVFFTIYGFIIIFLAVGGWVSPDNPVANTHAVLGVIIAVLTLLQPFGTLLRPSPDHPKRWIFNLAHAVVGYGLYVLAVINMFLGSILRDGIEPWTRWIVVAFAVVYLLTQAAHFLFKRSPLKSSSTENILQSGKAEQPKGSSIELVWYCYIAVALGFTIAVIVGIA